MSRSSTVPSSSSSSCAPSVAMMRSCCCCCRWWWWSMVACTLALLHHQQVHGLNDRGVRHEARVDSSQCSYTLVVNELDSSRCPVMQADALPAQAQGHPNHPWRDSPSPPESNRHNSHRYPPSSSAPKSQMRFFRQPSRHGGPGEGRGLQSEDHQEVGVLRGQVKELEGRLLDEMVRTRELNNTLSRHAGLLQQAEERLGMYGANFTAMYRAMVFVQRQLHKQRKINRSLNKKLSNVLLDVVEVNNVLNRGPTVSSAGGGGVNGPSALLGGPGGGVGGKNGGQGAKRKDFHVQSVANTRSCPGVTDQSTNFRDCAAVLEGGHRHSGVYYVKPTAAACPVPVWCDMDTPPGGWLVFQRRQDGSVPFKRNWAAYREGFGSVAGEHWLGNDNLFLLTNQAHYKLRVDLWDFSGNRVHATYSTFQVSGERDDFELTLGGHSGSAQDSLYRHNHMAFSTPDRDNDGRREAHCAAEWEAGWWFNNCWFALLNGLYHNRSDVQYRGIAWNHWKREQLRRSEMKIRPNSKDAH